MKKFTLMQIGFGLKDNFIRNKWCFLGLWAALLIGFFCGIGFAANGSVTFINVSVSSFFAVRIKVSVAGVFLRRMFAFTLCFAVVFACSCHFLLIPGNFILILLRGYYFGALCVLTIYQYAFSGVLLVIFALIPGQLIFLAALSLACCNGVSAGLCVKRFGCRSEQRQLLKLLCCCLVFSLVGTICECLLIVIIVNPFFI